MIATRPAPAAATTQTGAPAFGQKPVPAGGHDAADGPDAAGLRALPGFRTAARQAMQGLAEAYRGNLILNRLLNDRGRFTLGLLILGQHFDGAAGGPGLTAGRLKAEAAALGVCSPGRAGAVLAAFRLLGLVAPAPDADRRRHRLVVTDKFLCLHRERWRGMLTALAQLQPEGRDGLARLDDPAFVSPFVAALLAPFRDGWRPMHAAPSLSVFADRDGGMMIAFALLEAAQDGTAPTIADLARQFRVSRSHVLDVLQDAERAGLVRRDEARGAVSVEPALEEAMDQLVAAMMVRQAEAVRTAIRAAG